MKTYPYRASNLKSIAITFLASVSWQKLVSFWRPLKTIVSCDLSGNAVVLSLVGLQHVVPPTNTKFKPLHLPTQAVIPYTNIHKHRTSYFKSTLTFLGPAKRWKSIFSA